MYIEPFGVELWMNEWETRCEFNLAETCVQSMTVAELLAVTGHSDADLSDLLSMKLTYGDIEGSQRLRTAITKLYERQSTDNIVITHGTIGANMLIHKTLVEANDRVVAVVPTYQQHYSIPSSIGADVKRLKLREEHGFLPDLDELKELTTAGTRLIALTNPNNPTGALIERAMLEEIVNIARDADAWILCDEVYRGTDQHGNGFTESIADLYEKGISTASTSKAFALAGLRLGWIAGPADLLEKVALHRDYDTISVGMIDDHFATLAIENSDSVLERSHAITRTNLSSLSSWVDQEPRIDWVKPRSGTTALLKYDLEMTSRDFCLALLKATGVMFTPGSVLDMEGHVRVGYANDPAILNEGLARVSDFLAQLSG